ncbi:MAG: Veg family protein [Clostridiales bacterium]|nr:Veg family protein [Clostridiales bacterium]
MRRRAVNIQEVKRKIEGLRGKNLQLAVNKGRNQIVRLDGQIVDLFPYVFTFRSGEDLVSFSYSDIICGDIRIGYSG